MSISSIRTLQRRDKDLTSLYLMISLFILMILNMLNLHLIINMEQELEDKILERIILIDTNIKNNTFSFKTDGSFRIKLELLNDEIGQLQDNISNEIYNR